MNDVILCYSNKSSTTGKLLYERMKQMDFFGRVHKVIKNKLIRNSDILIRWGNSTSDAYIGGEIVELNKREAVQNTSNKLLMMKKLIECRISTPQLFFTKGINNNIINEMFNLFKDENGMCFIRNNSNIVRYDNNPTNLDLYISKPISNKTNEYRVHVVDDKVLGIYEKIPENDEVKIFKDHNCKFSRCNMELDNIRCNSSAQQLCIDAVKTLGLDFGGVDLMRDSDSNFYISEVNSSPSLNSINIDRYIEQFKILIERRLNEN